MDKPPDGYLHLYHLYYSIFFCEILNVFPHTLIVSTCRTCLPRLFPVAWVSLWQIWLLCLWGGHDFILLLNGNGPEYRIHMRESVSLTEVCSLLSSHRLWSQGRIPNFLTLNVWVSATVVLLKSRSQTDFQLLHLTTLSRLTMDFCSCHPLRSASSQTRATTSSR